VDVMIGCLFRYAMKCLDKKRIKLKGGETLALNERIMLSLVSTEVSYYRQPLFSVILSLSTYLSMFVCMFLPLQTAPVARQLET